MIHHLRSSASPWFSFLVHLRGLYDADRVGVGRFIRAFSCDDTDYKRKLETIPAVISSEVRFRSSAAYGEVICINRLPEQMCCPDARRDVLAAAALAISRGAKVIGLGALTAPATGGGLTIVRDLAKNVTLTNGNALTAAVVRRNVQTAAHFLCGSDERNVTVAIVGCTGSVGAAVTRLLAQKGYHLILIGRNRQRVEREFTDISGAKYSGDVTDIESANVSVLLTNDPAALVTPDLPAPDSIVIDCSQPANILPECYSAFAKRGIAVVEGGFVRIPDYSSTDDFGFQDRTETFACLAETYLFARFGIREHSVGRCTPERAAEMESLAGRFGIEPRPLNFVLQPQVQTASV